MLVAVIAEIPDDCELADPRLRPAREGELRLCSGGASEVWREKFASGLSVILRKKQPVDVAPYLE